MTPRPLFAVELSRAAKQIDGKRLTKREGPAWAALSVQPGSATSQLQGGEGRALGLGRDFPGQT